MSDSGRHRGDRASQTEDYRAQDRYVQRTDTVAACRHGMYRTYAETHIIPALGKRKLRDLTVEDVEKLLADKSAILSTRSLRIIHSILNRAIRKAQVRDKIRRNIVLLCEIPEGRAGRPSKSLTLVQAEAVLKAAEQASARMRAYIVVSLLTGARTEEMHALRWHDVDLTGQPEADPPISPNVALVRSVRVRVWRQACRSRTRRMDGAPYELHWTGGQAG